MKNKSVTAETIVSSVIVLCYVYPWVSFLLSLLGRKMFSLPVFAAVFTLALLLFLLLNLSGARRVTRLIVFAAAMFLSSWFLVNLYFPGALLSGPGSFSAYLFLPEKSLDGFLTALVINSTLLWLWASAAGIAGAATGKRGELHLFDRGAASFLVLATVKVLSSLKGVTLPPDPVFVPVFMNFFIAGIFLLYLKQRPHPDSKNHRPFAGTAGFTILFIFAVIAVVSVSLAFFHPGMKMMAEAGSGIVSENARFLEKGLIFIIRFFLDYNYRSMLSSGGSSEGSQAIGIPSAEITEGEMVFYYVFISFTAVAAAVSAAAVFYAVFRQLYLWLMEKGEKKARLSGLKKLFLSLKSAIVRILADLCGFFRKRGPMHAGEYFYRMTSWGAFSGVPRRLSETPREYAGKLAHRYPSLEDEIKLIVTIHDNVFYGGKTPGHEEAAAARASLRKIKNPLPRMVRMMKLAGKGRR